MQNRVLFLLFSINGRLLLVARSLQRSRGGGKERRYTLGHAFRMRTVRLFAFAEELTGDTLS